MAHGTVKWFNETKGFGFLESEGKDYFIHFSEIKTNGFKTLSPGEAVEFTPGSNAKGASASDVKKLNT